MYLSLCFDYLFKLILIDVIALEFDVLIEFAFSGSNIFAQYLVLICKQ